MQRLRLGGLTLFIWINAICFLSGSASGGGPEGISPPSGVTLEKGLLSVSLQDRQLKGVLEEISRQGGIKIVMEKPVERKVTMEFKNLPLEKGLKKLLEGTDYYMVFSPDQTGSPYAVKEVNIIPRSSGPGPKGSTIATPPSPTPTPPNPFIEALQSAKKKGEGSKKLTPEQKESIMEVFGKGSEENRKRAEELLKRLEEGSKTEEKNR